MATSIGVKLKMDGEAEFRKGLNNIVSSTKNLDKQLDVLEKSFDSEKKSMEQNAKQTELLERKKEQLQKQVEEMNKALEYAKDNYEENSAEVTSWEAALAQAESQLEETNQQIQANAEYQAEATSAYEELTNTISEQESQLDELRDAYIDAVLQFGEGSDEANELAGQISTLSDELNTNKGRLDDAQKSLQGVTSASQDTAGATAEIAEQENAVGNAISQTSSLFGSEIGSMVSTIANADIAGLFMTIGSSILGVIDNLFELQFEFDEALGDVAVMTGAVGNSLDDMKQRAIDAWAAVADKDASEEDYSRIVGTLNTRLGATGDELAELTELFGVYSATVGVDGATAVNDLVDVMQKWGMTSEDNIENYHTLNQLAGELVAAQQVADVSVTEMASALADQSGSFQELDMSIEDALGFMTAYRDAGGNTSDITRAIDQTINHLSGETDDLGASWDSMIEIMQTSDSKMDALQSTVAGTDKTLSDVFGSKLAGRIYDTFHSAGVDMDTFTAKVEKGGNDSYNALWRAFNDSRTQMDNFSQWFKETFSKKFLSDWTDTNDQTTQIMDETTADARIKGQEMLGNLQSVLSDSGNEITQELQKTYNKTNEIYDDIADDLSTPIPIYISAPSIGYTQSGTSYTPYSGGRYTFARGYDQAMMLTAPTVFGASGSNLLVGGDRPGNEIVVGEQHLLEMMSKVVGAKGNSFVVNVYGAEGQDVNALADVVADRIQMRIERSAAVYA